MTTATFTAGSLVRARGREWVVLPESNDDLLMVRPIGGLDDEVTGILRSIEDVQPATFDPPDPSKPGDYHACRLLRDAARLSTRSAAGPFRSFGRIGVEPRSYQLVPLLMALKLDPVRLLIADDVGIGKTIEACLIARELLDRGEVQRIAVLCPPHLAEQWQRELREKFHIEAELILSSTIRRLERRLQYGESVFQRHPVVIVSTDFIKQTKHRDDFLRDCPEVVIVDEAHTCTIAGQVGKARQQRFELVRRVAEDSDRHLILVTATPHSGNEEAFRSLLSLLNPKFANLPHDLEKKEREAVRRQLAAHLVQRRRADIRHFLEQDTAFPERLDAERTYSLTPEYRALFEKVLGLAGEMVRDESGGKRERRIRWWSALALLRALASSPAAAAATLRNRAATADSESEDDADELGRRAVLDQTDVDAEEAFDFTPGGDADAAEGETPFRKRLRRYAAEAEKLGDKKDAKVQGATNLVKELLKKGHNPILFCRFIDTAEYVAAHLRDELTVSDVEVMAVTGTLPPKDREDRIEELGQAKQRVLVCTDCLSEGVNLQEQFDAVMHYDLSWNPTRHEQREGRVDRFGQPKETVRVLTYFGKDNQIDGIVLDVLLRKHKQIRSDLGISVAVPGNSEDVVEALFEGMLLRERAGASSEQLLLADWLKPQKEKLHEEWESAKEREKKSRSRFAQHSIKTEEVAAELAAVREAIGAGPTVERFFRDVLHLAGVPVTDKPNSRIVVGLSNETPRSLRNALDRDRQFTGRFDLPVKDGEVYLSRTHPIVEGLASWVLDTALDPVEAQGQKEVARRCGVLRTDAVQAKSTVLLARFRYHLLIRRGGDEQRPLLVEEIRPLAFQGSPAAPDWVDHDSVSKLLEVEPAANVPATLVQQQLERLIGRLGDLASPLDAVVRERAAAVLDGHTRVRSSAKITGQIDVEPVLPPDLLGAFILLPNA